MVQLQGGLLATKLESDGLHLVDQAVSLHTQLPITTSTTSTTTAMATACACPPTPSDDRDWDWGGVWGVAVEHQENPLLMIQNGPRLTSSPEGQTKPQA